MTLPGELRNEIDLLVALQQTGIAQSPPETAVDDRPRTEWERTKELMCTGTDTHEPPLARACRQIRREFQAFYYEESIFPVKRDQDIARLRWSIGFSNLRRIRHVRVEHWVQQHGISYDVPPEETQCSTIISIDSRNGEITFTRDYQRQEWSCQCSPFMSLDEYRLKLLMKDDTLLVKEYDDWVAQPNERRFSGGSELFSLVLAFLFHLRCDTRKLRLWHVNRSRSSMWCAKCDSGAACFIDEPWAA